VVIGDLLRAVVWGLLTVTLVTGSVSTAVALGAMPLVGRAKVGGILAGQAIGGVVAQPWGVTAPSGSPSSAPPSS
jgi:hypothetical protein